MSDSDSEEETDFGQFEAVMDMARFQKFLLAEKAKLAKEGAQKAERRQLAAKSNTNDAAMPLDNTPPETPKLPAMNDTGKISRHRSALPQGVANDQPVLPNDPVHPPSINQQRAAPNMNDLQSVSFP